LFIFSSAKVVFLSQTAKYLLLFCVFLQKYFAVLTLFTIFAGDYYDD